ncbi:MAG: DedA family protein [Deltaproteobacteria bacterium]|nr:DedA family protein [Deltaproteobacteria bacterium]
MISELTAWVIHWASTPYGAFALFALALAESSFFPIPPDALLIALCLINPEMSFIYAFVCSIGSVLGGIVGYIIGLKGGRPLLGRWFKSDKVRLVEDYFQRWDVWAVGLAGFTPIPYKIFTISAGVFDLNFPRFLLTSIISRSTRFFIVAALFFFFGEPIKDLIERYFGLLTILFFILLFLGFYFIKIMGKRAAASGGTQDES